MKLRRRVDGEICSGSRFNMHSLHEIVVYGGDWCDTMYIREFDVWLEARQEWKDLQQAFRDHDVIVDNYNSRFFEPENEQDRARGFTL